MSMKCTKVIQMENTMLQHNNVSQNVIGFEAMNNRIFHALFAIVKYQSTVL